MKKWIIGVIGPALLATACDQDKGDRPDPIEPQPIEIEKADLPSVVDQDIVIDLSRVGSTIPVVNRYLDGLDKDLSRLQRSEALVGWLKSLPDVVDARIIPIEYPGMLALFDVAFSVMDGSDVRELILDFSSTHKVLSYHHDVVEGAIVKTKNLFIGQVFEFINALELQAEETYNSFGYASGRSASDLSSILDDLLAKPYTRPAWVTGNSGNPMTIRVHLYEMHDREYQADWLETMKRYLFTDSDGYIIHFRIPENPDVPASEWERFFDGYDFVEWFEPRLHRYTICDTSVEEDGVEGAVNVDSKITLRMMETIDRSPRTLKLYCTTAKQYGSGSNPLLAVTQQTGREIDIAFKGVWEVGMTADIGPARVYLDLGALDEGEYTLTLHNGSVEQSGRLVVSAESYVVDFEDNATFGFTDTRLNRIPEHTIWGLVGYHKGETAGLVQSFLHDLVALGATRGSFLPGDYHEYVIDGQGEINYGDALFGYWFERPFIFHYEADLARIEELVKQYARDHGQEMSIRVKSDKNDEFLSWMYHQ